MSDPYPYTCIQYDATTSNKNVRNLEKFYEEPGDDIVYMSEEMRSFKNLEDSERMCSTHSALFGIEYEFEGNHSDFLEAANKYNCNALEVIHEEGQQIFHNLNNDTAKKFRTSKHRINGNNQNCLIDLRPYGIRFFNDSQANKEQDLIQDLGKPIIMNWEKSEEDIKYIYGLQAGDENIVDIPKDNIRLDTLTVFDSQDSSIEYEYEIYSSNQIKLLEDPNGEISIRGRLKNNKNLKEDESVAISPITNIFDNKLNLYCSDTSAIFSNLEGTVTFPKLSHRRITELPYNHLWSDEDNPLVANSENFPSFIYSVEPQMDFENYSDKSIDSINEKNNILISNNGRIYEDDEKAMYPDVDYNFDILNRFITIQHPLNDGFKDKEIEQRQPIFIRTKAREYELVNSEDDDNFNLRNLKFSAIVNDNINGIKEDFKAEIEMDQIKISDEDIKTKDFAQQKTLFTPKKSSGNTNNSSGTIEYPILSVPETFEYEVKIDSIEPLEDSYNPLGLDFFDIDYDLLEENTSIKLSNYKIEKDSNGEDKPKRRYSLQGQNEEVLNNEITISCDYYANTMSTETITSSNTINYPNNLLGYSGSPVEEVDETGRKMAVSYSDLPWQARLPRVSDYNFRTDDIRGPYDYFVDSSNKNINFDIDRDNNTIYGITRDSIIWRPFVHTGYFYIHGDSYSDREERDPGEFLEYPISSSKDINIEEWQKRANLDEDLLPNFVQPRIMFEIERLARDMDDMNRAETNLGGEGHYYDFNDVLDDESPYVEIENAQNNEWHYYKAPDGSAIHLGGENSYEDHDRLAPEDNNRIIFVEGDLIFDRANQLNIERYHFIASGKITFNNTDNLNSKESLIYAGQGIEFSQDVKDVKSEGLIISHGNIEFNNSGNVELSITNDINLEHLPEAFIEVVITDLDTIQERYLYNDCRIDSLVSTINGDDEIKVNDPYITDIKPKQFAPIVVKGLIGVTKEELIVDDNNKVKLDYNESQIGNLRIVDQNSNMIKIENINNNLITLTEEDVFEGMEIKAEYLVGEEARIDEINRVIFFDNKGDMSLTNKEELEVSKDYSIFLTYNDPKLDSIEIKCADGTEIDILGLVDNQIYLDPNRSFKGQKVEVSYMVNNSYMLDKNYNPEIGDFELEFRFSSSYDQVLIHYENNSYSPFYDPNKIDINPAVNDFDKGFIYISDENQITNSIEEFLPRRSLNTLKEEYLFKIKLLDEDNNPIYNEYYDKDISITSQNNVADIEVLNNNNKDELKTLLGNSRADTIPDPYGNIYFKYKIKDEVNVNELTEDTIKFQVDTLEDKIKISFFTPELKERFAFIELDKDQNITTNYEGLPFKVYLYDENFNPVGNEEVKVSFGDHSTIHKSDEDGIINLIYLNNDEDISGEKIVFIETEVLNFDGKTYDDQKKITVYESGEFQERFLEEDQREPEDGIGSPDDYEPEEKGSFIQRSMENIKSGLVKIEKLFGWSGSDNTNE